MTVVKRALVSVSDKSGVVDFCKALSELGIEILSTGGTAKLLTEKNIDVVEVSEYTAFPEMMDGRVKTLHPKIHGALLGRRGVDDAVMKEHGITAIDLVVVNLYPFEETVGKSNCAFEDAIENIDIGGPAMLRSAAKNHNSVAAIVDTEDYDRVLKELRDDGSISYGTRFYLAKKVFSHTANYDANVSNYLSGLNNNKEPINYPLTYTSQFIKKQDLRYGENPHQTASFYSEPRPAEGTIASAKQIQGKELSYNNIADTDAAFECVLSFKETACTIVKHANPCGVATAATILEAYNGAYHTDPASAFGGIIAFNRELDAETAKTIVERQFVEVIIAPTISSEAIKIIASKAGIRLLEAGVRQDNIQRLNMKRVSGGLLLQDNDQGVISRDNLEVVTKRSPSAEEFDDLIFAWHVVKYVKSNAIVYARNKKTIGIGAGQMSRVYSARIAAIKAKDEKLKIIDAVMASDAFFPFRDGIDSSAKEGIRAIIQPGGSVRDKEVIAAADEHNLAMIFTKMRHFHH